MSIKELPQGRPLSPDETAAFLAQQASDYAVYIRRLRDECNVYPELLATYGFAALPHPTTAGLMSYLHDDVRHQHVREMRKIGGKS